MQHREGDVVVGIDGSEGSLRAMAWAAEHAAASHRSLHLVHVVATTASAYADGTSAIHSSRAVVDAGRRALVEARVALEHAFPGLEVRVTTSSGDPRETLLRLSQHAELVVVGSRGLGPLRSLLLGSVGTALVRRSHSPVVVVRPQPAGASRRGVVVGLEVAGTSAAVLDLAFRQAALRGQPLVMVHSTGDPYVGTTGAYRPVQGTSDPEHERLAIAETCAGHASAHPDVVVTTRTVAGRPEQALVEASDAADLVVVGAHQHALPHRVVSGSVAMSVVEHARGTVVVVPLRERPGGELS